MKLLEKILVPIDVNINSTKQIDSAIKIASAFKSEVTLLYVVRNEDQKNNITETLVESATKLLNEVKDNFESHGVTVEPLVIEFGNVSKAIVKRAKSLKVNLVIIAKNQEAKRKKYKLSTKSQQMLRALKVPVFLVSDTHPTAFTNILCPVDFSAPSERALHNAIAFADAFDAHLTILNVYKPIEYVSQRINVDFSEENELRLVQAKDEMKAFIKDIDFKKIKFTIDVVEGKAHHTILNTIKEKHINVLIMGTNGRTALSNFIMGSVTQKVIREMPCSFLTVKKINLAGNTDY